MRLLAALLLVLPATAGAVELRLLDKPLQLNITEYGDVAYHIDNGNIAAPGSISYDPTGSGYTDWLNRFQLDANWFGFTALLRLDSDLFIRPPEAAPGDKRTAALLLNRFGNRLDIEKVAVGYGNRYVEATLGDSYVTYGRGLVLALRKEDELGVDTTLRGAQVTTHLGGFNANALAGVSNIINVDTGTGREADDPDDLIVGSRAEYRFGKWVVPGADVALIRYAQNFNTFLPQKTHDRDIAYSGTLEFPDLWGHGSIYLEYAQQRPRQGDLEIEPPGTAFYGSATGYLGPATLLVEFKNYRHYEPIQTSLDPLAEPELALTDYYNAPPTLERIYQAVLDNSDVTGPHARLDYRVNPNFIPFISMAGFNDRVLHVNIYDPYGGFELHWQDAKSRASISGGRRLSRFDDTATNSGQLFQDDTHWEYDINQWITGPYSIELDGLDQHHHDRNYTVVTSWHEGQSYLSFKRAELYSFALGYEYYTEFPTTIRSNYFNASGTWNITQGTLLRLFAGGQRAGIKCVNGVCRNFPAFDGVRAELLAKF